MKRLLCVILIVFLMCFYTSATFALSMNNMTEEELIQKYEETKKERDRIKSVRNLKYDIIKNNNIEIESLKVDALDSITTASMKVNDLLARIQNNDIVVTEELISTLADILDSVQTANNTIKEKAVSLKEIVKLEGYTGYDSSVLVVLDTVIEKQNSIIVSYKQIIEELQEL